MGDKTDNRNKYGGSKQDAILAHRLRCLAEYVAGTEVSYDAETNIVETAEQTVLEFVRASLHDDAEQERSTNMCYLWSKLYNK